LATGCTVCYAPRPVSYVREIARKKHTAKFIHLGKTSKLDVQPDDGFVLAGGFGECVYRVGTHAARIAIPGEGWKVAIPAWLRDRKGARVLRWNNGERIEFVSETKEEGGMIAVWTYCCTMCV